MLTLALEGTVSFSWDSSAAACRPPGHSWSSWAYSWVGEGYGLVPPGGTQEGPE